MEFNQTFMYSSFSTQSWVSESFQQFENFCNKMNDMTSETLFDSAPFGPLPSLDMRPFSENLSQVDHLFRFVIILTIKIYL